MKGYAVNEHLRKEQIAELRQLVGMVTNALPPRSSCGSSTATAFSIVPTVQSVFPTGQQHHGYDCHYLFHIACCFDGA